MLTFLRRFVGYGLLAAIVAQVASLSPTFARYVLAGMSFEAAAIKRFPDIDACLFKWGEKPLWGKVSDEWVLRNLDWEAINTPDEARVCLTHVLVKLDNIEAAKNWLNAQGFPTIETTGISKIRRLNSSWSIAARGPAFSQAVFGPPFHSFPFYYGMTISSAWSVDGRQPHDVRISFNSK